jgi:SAM-dependent methyltransferase
MAGTSRYTARMDDKKRQTIATYDASAAGMAMKFEIVGPRTEDIQKAFSHAPRKGDPRVLELGCGNGRDALEILKLTKAYVGMDLSEGLLSMARLAAPGADFRLGDMETDPFPAGQDIIFAFASLLHSPQERVRAIMRKAHDALNPGGIFCINLKEEAYREHLKEDEFGARTFYYYTPSLIEELAGDAYQALWLDRRNNGKQAWFTMGLRKR